MAVHNMQYWEVRVQVPEDVWNKCRGKEFSDMFLEATKLCDNAGAWSNSHTMYARFKHEWQAKECDTKLRDLVEHFKNKLKANQDEH